MYLVLKLCKWENMKWSPVNPVEIVKPEGEAGFLKVFTDYQKALLFAGDPKLIMEVQEQEIDAPTEHHIEVGAARKQGKGGGE